MAYANRKQMSSNRTASIVVVALLHVVLGYALVTGLAYNVLKKATSDLKTFDVTEPPPPPEEKPPPPEKQPDTPPPPQVAAPPPMVPMPQIASPVQATPNPPPTQITLTAPPVKPAPVAQIVQQAARAKGSLPGLIDGENDYPNSARQAGEQGTVRTRLYIGLDGRVTNCEVVGSSGSSSLDSTTCSILKRRAKFTPAKDQNGNPVTDVYNAPGIKWVLQE